VGSRRDGARGGAQGAEMVVVEHEEPRESPQVSVEVEIERQDFTERRGEEILAVDRRREIEIEPRSRSRWRPRHRKAR
jgi:hypothetical protein